MWLRLFLTLRDQRVWENEETLMEDSVDRWVSSGFNTQMPRRLLPCNVNRSNPSTYLIENLSKQWFSNSTLS